jgi:hypothetical protein
MLPLSPFYGERGLGEYGLMPTRVKISAKNFIIIGVVNNILHVIRLRVGLYLAQALKEHEAFVRSNKTRSDGRLTEDEIITIRESEEDRLTDTHYRQRLLSFQITDEVMKYPDKASSYQQAALLCMPLLERGDVKSVVNVGTRVDIACSYLAQKFPQIHFTSIDFLANLAEVNSQLPQSPNWSFASGYALDLFENQLVKADLVLFSYTCAVIRNKELHQYFAALSKFANYIVLNEQWWPVYKMSSLLKVITPEMIDPDRSLLGGTISVYHHNYPKILERNGFEVMSSQIVEVYGREFWSAQIIAKNRARDI